MKIDFRAMLEILGALIVICGALWGTFHYMNDIHAGKSETQIKLLERDVSQKKSDAEKYRVQNLYWCERAEEDPNDRHAKSVCEYLEGEQQALMDDVKEDRVLLKQLKGEQ